MNKLFLTFLIVTLLLGCKNNTSEITEAKENAAVSTEIFPKPTFTLAEANKLIELPLHCVRTEYPYKPGETLESEKDLVEPIAVHLIIYGFINWISADYGYGSMLY